MKKIACVIVTYNRKELLTKCLDSLLNQSINNFDIFIIDNNSTDGTKEYIESYLKNSNILYFNTNKNLGGAGGFNFGIKKVLKDKYELIWMMDDDTVPFNNCLEEFLKAAETLDYNFGFMSSLAYFDDEQFCFMNGQKMNSQNSIFTIHPKNTNLLKILNASFVSIFINSFVISQCGLPQTEFFIWGDDIEFTNRITNITKNNYLVLSSKVHHLMKSNIDNHLIHEEDLNRIERFSTAFRNSFCIAKRKSFLDLLLYHKNCFIYFIKFLFISKKHKFYKIWQLIKGYFIGLFFNPKIEYYNYDEQQDN